MKFAGSQVPKSHPALGRLARQVFDNPIGLGGNAAGIGKHHHGPYTGTHVMPQKIGIPADGDIRFGIIGNPRIDGELPGASGAQLSGKLIHHPPPNPQERPSMRSCVALMIASTACGSKPRVNSFPF